MKYSAALNNKTLKMNTGDFLKKLDADGDGKISQDELKNGLKDSASIFAKPLISDAIIKKINAMYDKDKDGTISEKELANYLKQNYGLDINEAKKMNTSDLLKYLEEHGTKNKK